MLFVHLKSSPLWSYSVYSGLLRFIVSLSHQKVELFNPLFSLNPRFHIAQVLRQGVRFIWAAYLNHTGSMQHRKKLISNDEKLIICVIFCRYKLRVCSSHNDLKQRGLAVIAVIRSWQSKTVFLLTIFRNRKRWNREIVNGMWEFDE